MQLSTYRILGVESCHTFKNSLSYFSTFPPLLNRYNIVIFGGVDGYSRKVIDFCVCVCVVNVISLM